MILNVQKAEQQFRSGFWMQRVRILQGIDLQVPERSIFGFLGANGAGKTTLIHLIAGIRRPFSGKVEIAGLPAHTREARSKVGYLPERPYFHEHLTGAGLLQYMGELSGMPRKLIRSRTTKVLSAVGMSEARDIELRKYSKGMLQRIGIAQAILHDPEFLVLDEPMSGLDPLGRKEVRELILSLAGEGRTVFFSTHVIPDVEAICDQVALIQKGKLIGCGPIGELLAQGSVQTEVAFAGVSQSVAEKIPQLTSLRAIPNGFRANAAGQDAVNDALKSLIHSGAKILWVTPIRASLETFFK